MKTLDAGKAALTFGLLLGGWHLVWSLLVLTGLAQPLYNFVLWMHMLSIPIAITSFTVYQAGTLIVVTFILGYLMGWVFAWLWNQMYK